MYQYRQTNECDHLQIGSVQCADLCDQRFSLNVIWCQILCFTMRLEFVETSVYMVKSAPSFTCEVIRVLS